MDALEKAIITHGRVAGENVLKVDGFLNHQLDVDLLNKIGAEFFERFKDCGVTKILTIEVSGIAIAAIAAQYFKVPVVFAKKSKSLNLDGEVYCSKVISFTHETEYNIMVSRKFIGKSDRVLIIDDFLAKGSAMTGLIDLVAQSQAELVGAGIVIEKGFDVGGDMIRGNGIRLESLAIIESMSEKDNKIIFRKAQD